MLLIRKTWFRVSWLCICLGLANIAILVGVSAPGLRYDVLRLIPAVSILFAVTAALALAIMSNSVFGRKAEAYRIARDIRERAWAIIDRFSDTRVNTIRSLLQVHIRPLAAFSLREYQSAPDVSDFGTTLRDRWRRSQSQKTRNC